MPVTEFAGGKVHKVDEGIYHLIRGEVYTLENNKFFVFGGATSHDKEHRTEGKNWWKGEMPSEEEYEKGKKNILNCGYSFDYILTHCALPLCKSL